jgi:hypothetical protein
LKARGAGAKIKAAGAGGESRRAPTGQTGAENGATNGAFCRTGAKRARADAAGRTSERTAQAIENRFAIIHSIPGFQPAAWARGEPGKGLWAQGRFPMPGTSD